MYKLNKRTEDLTGKIFGKLTVLEFAGYNKQQAQWLCKCRCGNRVAVLANNLKRRMSKSCGNCNPVKLGDKFGKLTVIESVKDKIDKNGWKVLQWLCRCGCGRKTIVFDGFLKNGHTTSCGNCNPIHIGDKFGKLTVIKLAKCKIDRNGWKLPQWLCQCVCGRKKVILACNLKNGHTKSCRNCNPIKTGNRFGELVVLGFVGYKKQKDGFRKPQWLCRCICGNEKTIYAGSLKSGNTKSCGCMAKGGYSKKYNLSYDSSWELNFVKVLEYLEIEWQREPKEFKLSNGKKYTPDFYLPEFNMFIEIKGRWYEDKNGFSISKEKTELFKKEYPEYNYHIIDEFRYKEWEKEFKFVLEKTL